MGKRTEKPRRQNETALAGKAERRDRVLQLRAVYLQKQWFELREYAHEHDIAIIGDIPIFVAPDSADIWADKSCSSSIPKDIRAP